MNAVHNFVLLQAGDCIATFSVSSKISRHAAAPDRYKRGTALCPHQTFQETGCRTGFLRLAGVAYFLKRKYR